MLDRPGGHLAAEGRLITAVNTGGRPRRGLIGALQETLRGACS